MDEAKDRSADVITYMKLSEIKLLAIDFDLTTIDLHTGGRWKDSSLSLAQHVRPVIKELIMAANSAGIIVSVVTFSSQVTLVRNVFKHSFQSEEFVEKMIIEGGMSMDSMRVGKRKHIERVNENLQRSFGIEGIDKKSILLIDDDKNNIRLAKHDGYKAVALVPNNPERLYHDVLNLI